jgi:hypothetical protein
MLRGLGPAHWQDRPRRGPGPAQARTRIGSSPTPMSIFEISGDSERVPPRLSLGDGRLRAPRPPGRPPTPTPPPPPSPPRSVGRAGTITAGPAAPPPAGSQSKQRVVPVPSGTVAWRTPRSIERGSDRDSRGSKAGILRTPNLKGGTRPARDPGCPRTARASASTGAQAYSASATRWARADRASHDPMPTPRSRGPGGPGNLSALIFFHDFYGADLIS